MLTQHFQYKREKSLNYPKFAAMVFFFKVFNNEFETAVVNEPSVFEPLKFYCICDSTNSSRNSDIIIFRFW